MCRAMTLELGTGSILGRYELLEPVAKGGMAQVWLARLHGSRGFNKLVAVKTILGPEAWETRSEAMLLEEARLAASVHHPNVVTTLDLGEEAGLLYLVMEWVHGESLREVYRRASEVGGIPLPLSVNLLAQACKGLHAAHEAKNANGTRLHMVHRDISPQNLLISYSGVVKVADFGIAKAKLTAAELTQPGELKGKASFMSPEQLASQPLDCRSDIFAMGTLLYQVTTGHHPFRGATMSRTLDNICKCDPPRPSVVHRNFPKDLEQVIVRALEKDPDRRFQSAAQLYDALAASSEGGLVGQYELPVAEYMRQLMGDREQERLQMLGKLLHAGTGVAQRKPTSSNQRSAEAIGSGGSPSSAAEPHSLEPHSMVSEVAGDFTAEERPSNTTLVSRIRQLRSRRWIAATTAAGALTLGVMAGLDLADPRPETFLRDESFRSLDAASRAATPVPAVQLSEVQVDGSPGLEARQPGTDARVSALIAPSLASTAGNVSPKSRELQAPVIESKPALISPIVKPISHRQQATVAPEESKGKTVNHDVSPSVTVNAWDRSLYGGRN